LVGGSGYSLN